MVVRNGLLVMLEAGPKYGYQLKTEFDAGTGNVWSLNIGQVYTTLGRLVRDGFVEQLDSEESEPQRLYRITSQGRDEVRKWFTTPVDRATPRRDELTAKLLLALRYGQDVREVVQVQRGAAVRVLQEYTRLKMEASPEHDLAWLILLDSLILQTEAELRWLDLVEARAAEHRPGAGIPSARAAKGRAEHDVGVIDAASPVVGGRGRKA